ncbi:MAG TPA: ribosome recycling factor [Halanaerobiaceae bacterium]|nr:ribosome recycling factor [Bacillota bacterium]HHU91705.1 ribosome recycling factor [Halanaerobiaceae bacterium]HOA40414.1 ribosome recycling factor [Halanaerobiales bacterium]HPZ62560.1 ribosome recycling factor [Halanaerobiales bacterium]HQD03144.1 ribosome recycling factor [Halanaerobiales bacterium]
MIEQVKKKAEEKMKKTIEATKEDFGTIRTGRARPSLLNNVMVDYYGALTPVNQMAKVSAPEPRLLVIEPWDKSMLGDIERAILKANLGLVPNNDGTIIRISIPQLTEERRKELVKVVRDKAEKGKIAIRSIRQDANSELKKLEGDGEISEDTYHRGLDAIQDLTNNYIEKVDELLKEKEDEIMEV